MNDVIDPFAEFLGRIRLGLRRKQVVLGQDKLMMLAKGDALALVWVTEDLSKQTFGKLRIVCDTYAIPILRRGTSAVVGETTGYPTAKVYLLRKSFSGIRHLLQTLGNDENIQ